MNNKPTTTKVHRFSNHRRSLSLPVFLVLAIALAAAAFFVLPLLAFFLFHL